MNASYHIIWRYGEAGSCILALDDRRSVPPSPLACRDHHLYAYAASRKDTDADAR